MGKRHCLLHGEVLLFHTATPKDVLLPQSLCGAVQTYFWDQATQVSMVIHAAILMTQTIQLVTLLETD